KRSPDSPLAKAVRNRAAFLLPFWAFANRAQKTVPLRIRSRPPLAFFSKKSIIEKNMLDLYAAYGCMLFPERGILQ
ncbi:MAG: hypothetical protein Q4G52_10750, partial [Clostridia bacterium]|nr:hypothetical protein [Clostridia bacterium]